MTSEKSIVEAILKRLNAMPGVRAVKRHGSPFSRKGEPDIDCVVLHPGMNVGLSVKLEVKRPGELPTKIQELEMSKWMAVGATVAVVNSVDDAVQIVKNIHGYMIA